MVVRIDGMDIFYKRYDGEGTPILILHGWGASSEAMAGLHNYFVDKGRSVISMDFPFFGQSSPPPDSFSVFDYALLTQKFILRLALARVSILAHSFGGRVAIILAAENPSIIEKLVLIDAAGCKPKHGLKYRYKVLTYKAKKKLGLVNGSEGSSDYRALPEGMKSVFVRVVNTHLHKQMKRIKAPTLLIWGKDDKDTPLYMARRMNKLICDSGLVVLSESGHFSFGDRLYDVCITCNEFLNYSSFTKRAGYP